MKRRKLLSALLALIMLLSLLPVSSFAESDVEVPEAAVAEQIVDETPAEEVPAEEAVEEVPAVEETAEEVPAVEKIVEEVPAVEETVEEPEVVEEPEEEPLVNAIVAQPQDLTVVNGERAVFSVEVTGNAVSFQWQSSRDNRRWSNLNAWYYGSDAELGFYPTRSDNGYYFRVVVTFENGEQLISEAARLSVASVVITAQPQDLSVEPDSEAVFTVGAKGSIYYYQWQYSANGSRWSNLNTRYYGSSNTLRFIAEAEDDGLYIRALVYGRDGSRIATEAAKLTVAANEPEVPVIEDVKVDGTSVSVDAPEGAFPEGTQLELAPVSGKEAYTDVMKTVQLLNGASIDDARVIDFNFTNGAQTNLEPNGDVTVSVAFDEPLPAGKNYALVHVDDYGNASLVNNASVTPYGVTFTTDSFSVYLVLAYTSSLSEVPFVAKDGTTSIQITPAGAASAAASADPAITSIAAGTIADNAPTLDGYTFVNATVGTDVAISLGAFYAYYDAVQSSDPYDIEVDDGYTIEGDKYVIYNVFYRTAESSAQSDILVLIAGQTINLNYEKTPYSVTYQVVYNGNTYTVGQDTLPADLADLVVTGPSAVDEGTTYDQAVVVSLPRGYSATVRMSNESSTQSPALGEGSEPSYSSDGWQVSPEDYPFTLEGTYTISNVNSDLTVSVNVSKRSSFRFNATPAFSTAYFGGRQGDTRRYTTSDSLNTTFAGPSKTFTFTTRNTTRIEWALDSFNINKQTINVPYVNSSNRTASETTTLQSGTVITLSATYNNDGNRTYTLQIDNCYENISITGGNLHNLKDQQEWVVQQRENLAEFDYLGDNWLPLKAGEPMSYSRTGNQYTARVIRFKVKDGYVNPQIKYVTQEGTDQYTRVGDVTLASASEDQYHLVTSNPSSDGYYYFHLEGTLSDPGLLSVKAELARYGVNYKPGDVSDASVPDFDNGGTYGDGSLKGYNAEDNNIIALSTNIPADPNDNFVFVYYTIEGDDSNTQYASSQKIDLEDVVQFASFDDSKGEFVINFVAHWIDKAHAETVTITVNFNLDGALERTVQTQVTKGSAVYIDINSEEMGNFMTDYDWQLFYDEIGSKPYIENAETDETVNLQIYSKFYVYHSATDKLELHTTKELTNGTLDITALKADGTYYGGYYKAFSNSSTVQAAADDNNENGTLTAQDVMTLSNKGSVVIGEKVCGTTYDPINSDGSAYWGARSNAFTTVKIDARSGKRAGPDNSSADILKEGGTGTAMTPARACIYYLCEVPSAYLATPKVLTINENYGQGEISAMTLLSVTDTSLYRTGGMIVDNSNVRGSFATTFTVTKQDQGSGTSTTMDTLTPQTAYKVNGRLTVSDGSKAMSSGLHVLEPFWITYDNVTVKGGASHTRTITVSGNTVS